DVSLLEGDVASLRALLAPQDGAWREAQAYYERALASVEGAKRARALNNMAFTLLREGDAGGAERRWAEAIPIGKDAKLAAGTAAPPPATRERLEPLARDDGACSYAARNALLGLAIAAKAPKKRQHDLAADAVRALDVPSPVPDAPDYAGSQ